MSQHNSNLGTWKQFLVKQFNCSVAYHSSGVHPHKSRYVTPIRGSGGLWVRVCALPSRSFIPCSGLRPDLLAPSFLVSPSISLSLSFSYSTEIMWTQELATPSFSLVLRWSIWTRTSTTTVFESPNGFLQNKHLILLFWPPVLRDMYFWCKA